MEKFPFGETVDEEVFKAAGCELTLLLKLVRLPKTADTTDCVPLLAAACLAFSKDLARVAAATAAAAFISLGEGGGAAKLLPVLWVLVDLLKVAGVCEDLLELLRVCMLRKIRRSVREARFITGVDVAAGGVLKELTFDVCWLGVLEAGVVAICLDLRLS
ncbi:hypothetical protein FF38_08101 [Lucilia cuprina]|uniref:Uncharacterized protein n=1 Tax=Lucilia cuprina TaxID=7375 RepID=A0A0L0CN94_LUCCU|nr:hypothetical protein FF38_08101 [Lucilia cuprina]